MCYLYEKYEFWQKYSWVASETAGISRASVCIQELINVCTVKFCTVDLYVTGGTVVQQLTWSAI
jgi:hypothetical protein